MFIDYKKISSKMQSNAKKPKIKTIKIQKKYKNCTKNVTNNKKHKISLQTTQKI